MTVPTLNSVAEFVTNGVTTNFPFFFKFLANEDLVVTYVDPFGVSSVLTLGSQYTVNGAGSDVGGSIVTTSTLAGPGQLVVSREMDAYQQTSLRNQGKFLAETHEDVFDRLTMLIQQGYSIFKRALMRPFGRDYFYAENRRITSVADPTEAQDAVTKYYNERYIAGLLDDFTGPLNNAANVMYIYPDGVARSVQTLATKNDPLLGSAGIGHNNTTVRGELIAINAEIDANALDANNKIAELDLITDQMFSNTIEPAIIDLHFGTLQGVGWTASEPGNIVAHTVTGSTSNTITLNNVVGLYAGQLIVYQATDGNYYTSVIKLIGTLTLTLALPLPAPVANGAQLYNFYRDDAHANTYGFNAVADDALRQLTSKRLQRLEYQAKDTAIWTPLLGATLTTQTTAAYINPGAAAIGERGLMVASPTIDAGCISFPVALAGGDYVTNIVVNPGTRDGGFTGILDIGIEEVTAEGLAQTVAFLRLSPTWGAVTSQDIKYTVRPGSSVRVRLTSPNAGPWTFYVGPITHNRVGGYMNNLNRGKHVLLGDSWFTSGGDFHNRLIARLNKATVISAGVPGNRASQLIARFATDVAPQNPDYVWVMVGTNDYYANVNNNDFEQQINQLRNMIQAIGAQPIFFNATVGAISYVPEQLTKSRSYALNVRYVGQEQQPNGAGSVQRNFTVSQSLTVAAGATVTVAVSPGQTRLPALIRFLTQSITGLTLRLEYASAADGAGGIDLSTFTGISIAKDFIAPRTDTSLRFVALRVANGTGSPITATILADICWQQSLV